MLFSKGNSLTAETYPPPDINTHSLAPSVAFQNQQHSGQNLSRSIQKASSLSCSLMAQRICEFKMAVFTAYTLQTMTASRRPV